jgi:hypothetical protein
MHILAQGVRVHTHTHARARTHTHAQLPPSELDNPGAHMGVQGGPLGADPGFLDGQTSRGGGVGGGGAGAGGGAAGGDGTWRRDLTSTGGAADGGADSGSHSLRAARRKYNAGEMSQVEYDHLRHVLSPDNPDRDIESSSREWKAPLCRCLH